MPTNKCRRDDGTRKWPCDNPHSRRHQWVLKPSNEISRRNRVWAQKSPQRMYINFKGEVLTLGLRSAVDKVTRLTRPPVAGGDMMCLFMWPTGKGTQSLLLCALRGVENPQMGPDQGPLKFIKVLGGGGGWGWGIKSSLRSKKVESQNNWMDSRTLDPEPGKRKGMLLRI